MFKKVIYALIIYVWFVYLFTETDQCFCVIVEKKEHYIGKFLKRDYSKVSEIKDQDWCKWQDIIIDNSDGAKKGLVRWMNCRNWEYCTWYGDY